MSSRMDPLLRFSIAPTRGGAWSWRTFALKGEVRAQGLAPSRKLAAALVVRDILRARCEGSVTQSRHTPAKAA